ncbi:MAG: hypothetical protein CFE37_12905 [Alphaproteobacteria bacterium PA4]|nr:MAG: hypothetical protein CFE37_12905 [Alphaproteobacteria bacterium PA4]
MFFERLIVIVVTAAALVAGVDALQTDMVQHRAPAALAVSTTVLALNPDDPGQQRLGPLRFLGAVQIRSSDAGFGGISALRAGPGTRMLAVTDTGNWLAFDTVERDGRLVGVANAYMRAIPQPGGTPLRRKADGDAEALDWDAATGTASIVYEQDHRIAHFTGIDATPASLAAPPERIERLTQMLGWGNNSGGEAMAVLPGGARVILAEQARHADGSRVALLTAGGVTREIAITGVAGMSPTDAVALDDHTILILHRRFSSTGGLGAALSRVDLAPALAGGTATLPMTLLARWQAPVTLDNMEGLALRHDGGRVFVYLVSDDNFNSLERTLLLKFELMQ